MKIVIIAAAVAFFGALLGTPMLIRLLVSRGYGQYIRDDGPTGHYVKRGTPTMGGIVIIVATVLGYAAAHLIQWREPSVSGLLLLGLMTGMGVVGFLDDFTKIQQQRSLGLTGWQKLLGQILVATVFGVLALYFHDGWGRAPATTKISFVRDLDWNLAVFGPVAGMILFVIWANLIVAGASNGVNLTDGLDGLATGACVAVFGAYVLISVWQLNQNCVRYTDGKPVYAAFAKCYDIRDPRDLMVVSACLAAACFGFLWWNASPAKIFMGDTGALALGGALGGLAILTHTELLLPLLGGLFVIITLSVIIQRVYFKLTRKRVFKMAPLQHHFELKGWNEVTIVIRFWIIAGMSAALAMGMFYGEWVVGS